MRHKLFFFKLKKFVKEKYRLNIIKESVIFFMSKLTLTQ